ncbi:MAG: histidine triad nucleotide-binding protein [Candidatus Omnitrophica bacterium]|nr:histidine triad nucleotide-binding protein [Candidatus Omnitrophota bacterium]
MTASKNDCIFCKIANKEMPVQLEYEDGVVAAFKDKNPQAPVHILIVPKTHIPSINNATERDTKLLGDILISSKNIAAKLKISDSGYRLVINCGRGGGQLVDHLHLHLLGGRTFSWPPG